MVRVVLLEFLVHILEVALEVRTEFVEGPQMVLDQSARGLPVEMSGSTRQITMGIHGNLFFLGLDLALFTPSSFVQHFSGIFLFNGL